MSDLWVGAFAALAVWQLVQTLVGVITLGSTQRINRTTVAVKFSLMVIFMGAAWFMAVFGGG